MSSRAPAPASLIESLAAARATRRQAALSSYRAVLQRVDRPRPGDAETLASAMVDLEVDDAAVTRDLAILAELAELDATAAQADELAAAAARAHEESAAGFDAREVARRRADTLYAAAGAADTRAARARAAGRRALELRAKNSRLFGAID